MKRTKIVATIGPETDSYDMLKKLGEAGVNIFRLNFSHGTYDQHLAVIKNIQKLNKDTKKHYAVMLDTKGPEIRTATLTKAFELKKGDLLTLTTNLVDFEQTGKLSVNYKGLTKDVGVGEIILLDNGTMTLKVQKKTKTDVICRIIDGGELTSRRHINIPGKDVSLPSITEQDWKDLAFGIKHRVDFFALSFVRNAKDIEEVRAFLSKHKSPIKIIAKVETLTATRNIDEIFEAADGVMVARGDLGVEIPFQQVPIVQWEIAQKGAQYKKPVIVATHMLESMIEEPMPTRAEVTDIFTSALQRNDCVMLSAETSVGKYPIKSVQAMTSIVTETENHCLDQCNVRMPKVDTERGEFCSSAARAAADLPHISSIVVITKHGSMARFMSSFRPSVPIYALTDNPSICQQMQILWGVTGFVGKFSRDPEKTVQLVKKLLLKNFPKYKGTSFVLISDVLVEKQSVPSLQIRKF